MRLTSTCSTPSSTPAFWPSLDRAGDLEVVDAAGAIAWHSHVTEPGPLTTWLVAGRYEATVSLADGRQLRRTFDVSASDVSVRLAADEPVSRRFVSASLRTSISDDSITG